MSTTIGTASAPARFIRDPISRQLPVRGRRRTPPREITMSPRKPRTSRTSTSASYVPCPIWARVETALGRGRRSGLASPW